MRGAERDGFTLIEAVVALAIIGVVAIGAFVTVGTQLRTEARAQGVWAAEALAEERMASLVLADARTLKMLPDSLRRGRFAPPYMMYLWTAEARVVPRERDLWDIAVTVRSPENRVTLRTRRWRAPVVAEIAR